MSENMGLGKLKERFNDAYMEEYFAGLFPKGNPRNTRCVNEMADGGVLPLSPALSFLFLPHKAI